MFVESVDRMSLKEQYKKSPEQLEKADTGRMEVWRGRDLNSRPYDYESYALTS